MEELISNIYRNFYDFHILRKGDDFYLINNQNEELFLIDAPCYFEKKFNDWLRIIESEIIDYIEQINGSDIEYNINTVAKYNNILGREIANQLLVYFDSNNDHQLLSLLYQKFQENLNKLIIIENEGYFLPFEDDNIDLYFSELIVASISNFHWRLNNCIPLWRSKKLTTKKGIPDASCPFILFQRRSVNQKLSDAHKHLTEKGIIICSFDNFKHFFSGAQMSDKIIICNSWSTNFVILLRELNNNDYVVFHDSKGSSIKSIWDYSEKHLCLSGNRALSKAWRTSTRKETSNKAKFDTCVTQTLNILKKINAFQLLMN